MIVKCEICKKDFYAKPNWIKKGHGRFCSRKCFHVYQKGKPAHYNMTGKNNPNWKGGKHIDKLGYILSYFRKHPNQPTRSSVKEHRLVMEKHLGRYLKPEEVIHHINGIKTDNRIENLMLFANHKAHTKYHHELRSISLSALKDCGRE